MIFKKGPPSYIVSVFDDHSSVEQCFPTQTAAQRFLDHAVEQFPDKVVVLEHGERTHDTTWRLGLDKARAMPTPTPQHTLDLVPLLSEVLERLPISFLVNEPATQYEGMPLMTLPPSLRSAALERLAQVALRALGVSSDVPHRVHTGVMLPHDLAWHLAFFHVAPDAGLLHYFFWATGTGFFLWCYDARDLDAEAPPLPTTHLWLLPPHNKTTISKIHVGAETHFLQTMASKGLTFCAALPACTDSRELYALFTHPP